MPLTMRRDAAAPPLATAPVADPGWPPLGRAWVTVIVLMTAYALAFVDRQILTLLVEPIRRDLAITDTQFSLLSGLAFTLFYVVMGIPLAWVGDRGSRRNLIMVAVVGWSVMTAACGLASNFLTLFVARIGVGVGEAGLSPAAYSLIADSFAPARRARPLGVYAIGSIAGAGLALIIGGAVIRWASAAPPVTLPVFGVLRTWQVAFLIVSLPGPILALVMAGLREPKRQGAAASTAGASERLLPFLRQRWLVYSLLAAGYSLIGVAIAAYLTWTPAFLIRVYGWEVSRVGAVLGAILLVFSTSGVLLGGWWADRLTALGRKDGVLRVAIIGSSLAFPIAASIPFAPTGGIAAGMLAIMFLSFGLTQGLPAVTFQAIAPNRVRARAMSLYLLIGNLVAFTIGPTAVAVINDRWLHDPSRIGVAVAIVSAVMVPLGVLALVAARGPYMRAVDQLERSGDS